MNKIRSAKSFINQVLTSRGFFMKKPCQWYKKIQNTLIVISLEPKRYDCGVRISYGLSFRDTSVKQLPNAHDCAVYGENPAMTPTEFKKFRELLCDVKAICSNLAVQDKIAAGLDIQINCLLTWCDRDNFRKRIHSGKPFEMLVIKPLLGFRL